jgi:hypothetical protein
MLTARPKETAPTLHHWFCAADPSLVAHAQRKLNGAGIVKLAAWGKGSVCTEDLAGNARNGFPTPPVTAGIYSGGSGGIPPTSTPPPGR